MRFCFQICLGICTLINYCASQSQRIGSKDENQNMSASIQFSKIHGFHNYNSKSRYIELVVVNDKEMFQNMNEDFSKLIQRNKNIINVVNGIFSPLNIHIALVGIEVWSDENEIEMSPVGDLTLTKFLEYRRKKLVNKIPNDYALLLTGTKFEGAVLGKSLKGPICTVQYSGSVVTDYNNDTETVGKTVAHSIGHIMGMEHDGQYCDCLYGNKCIMHSHFTYDSENDNITNYWSNCSVEYLNAAYERGMDSCLKNLPVEIVGPVCGNSFVEDGEECDCGLQKFCDNQCCNATSCKLFSNATCANGQCCDIETCKVKPIGTMCRDAASECDLPEYCNGITENCPKDVYKLDGLLCKNEMAFCSTWQCRSHESQCKLLWKESGQMADEACFQQNIKGTRNGNCGYSFVNDTFEKCVVDDALCGLLHCTHSNDRLEFGMESTSILARSFIAKQGSILKCSSALLDLGLDIVNPGLVLDGSKCGENKMCLKQKCVPVESLNIKKCLNGCSDNGVCNSNGNCHCNYGYSPPLCDKPGTGGSVDSEPPN